MDMPAFDVVTGQIQLGDPSLQKPSRREPDGRKRPLGITALEDRMLQAYRGVGVMDEFEGAVGMGDS
jgi:hypothetical protein